MEVESDPRFRAELLKKIHDREFGHRTGVHQSDLNYCLNRQAFRKLYPKEDVDRETLIYSLGYSTQRWLTGQDKDEPEMDVDGIKVTLDSVTAGDDAISQSLSIPFELKATFTSSNKPIEENIPWLRQIMAQCYVKGATQAKLTRLCIMGNWLWVWNGRAKPEKLAQLVAEHGEDWDEHPVLQAFDLQFTQAELERNWQWFLGRKPLYLQVIESGKPLPKAIALPPGGEWECSYCKYIKECGGCQN